MDKNISTRSLAKIQSRAALSRTWERFCSPRRIFLSVLGVALGIIWAGQAVLAILLRETADPDKLAMWIPVSFTMYAIWNLIKVVFRKPIHPFEWTPAEKELLVGAPIEAAELIRFRFSKIFKAALVKSTIFTLVMIPDLAILPLGLLGMLLALLIIDLLRMLGAVVVWGLSRRELWTLRVVVGGIVACVLSVLFSMVYSKISAAGGIAGYTLVDFLSSIFVSAMILWQTTIGTIITAPLGVIADVVLANQFNVHVLLRLLASGFMAWGLLKTVYLTDKVLTRRRNRLERANLPRARELSQKKSEVDTKISLRKKPFRLGGLGPLGWRQLIGARNYRGQVIFALLVPMILCCLPALTGSTGLMLVMNVTGGLAFYSFLLLPSAMPFDMRRDLKRITVLKSLPISPTQVVLGQLIAPVVLTSVFQIATLLATWWISPFQPAYLLVALGLLLPFNLFIFGWENLLMLWYPYRLNQEGVKILLRTILAFTAKGVMFGVAAAGVLSWAFASKWLGATLFPQAPATGMSFLFTVGGCLAMLATSAVTIKFLARSFERFDPTCDLAGLD